jgi:hypothetical protein
VVAERVRAGLRSHKEDAAFGLAPVHRGEVRGVTHGLEFGVDQPCVRVGMERVRLHRRGDGHVFRGAAVFSLVRHNAGDRADRLRVLDVGDPRTDAAEDAEQAPEQLQAQYQQDDDKVGNLLATRRDGLAQHRARYGGDLQTNLQ